MVGIRVRIRIRIKVRVRVRVRVRIRVRVRVHGVFQSYSVDSLVTLITTVSTSTSRCGNNFLCYGPAILY